jgi:hypothetical protein
MKQLMIVCAAAAMLAACGSAAAEDREVASLSTTGVDDTTTDTSDAADAATESTGVVDPSEGPLQFAKCMREHGIDMPDPTIGDNGGVMVQIGGPGQDTGEGPDPKDVDAANKECQEFLEKAGAGFEPPSAEDQRKMQEHALEFSKCMRDHGIDMPDPQFSTDGGGFSVSIGSEDGAASDVPMIDPSSDEFKEASEACGQDGGGFVVSADPAGG